MKKLFLIGLFTLPMVFSGCREQFSSESTQEIVIPMANFQIEISKIELDKAVLQGSLSLSHIPDSLAPASVHTSYYYSPTENELEFSDIKWFLGDNTRMNDFSRPINLHVDIGPTADFDINHDKYLIVLTIIRPLDQTIDPIRLWTINEINWTPNQGMDPTR